MTLEIPEFSRVRPLVAGDAMLDEYWFGETSRISPEAPVPVVRRNFTEQRPGGAANVALNIAALGARPRFCAIVGDDERADLLEQCLRQAGVDTEFLRASGFPTIHKLRVLVRNQQLIRLDAEGSIDGSSPDYAQLFERSLPDADVAILSDYGKGTLSEVQSLISLCRNAGCAVVVDPKGTDFTRYRGATTLTPNQLEFEAVVGIASDEQDLVNRAQRLRVDLEIDFLLITRGERGMTLISEAGQAQTFPAQAREVFDVTGAGDTVVALLGTGIGAGLPAADAVALANLGAGLVVGKIGVASVSRAELAQALHLRGYGGRGLGTLPELESIVTEAKARGERIVMTNGCFDILHAGHVSYLEEAKSLGDRLIVAVNDDASVARLKGASRPITPLEDRMAVLAGLAAVDWVVPFSGDTPAAEIERLLPDVLVKGGDWKPDQIAGAEAVLANGGEVRVLDYKPGRSTTAMIDAIRSS